MTDEDLNNVQRWTAKRRMALVLSIIKGETTVTEAARKHGLKIAEIEEWKERFTLGAEKWAAFPAQGRGRCEGRPNSSPEAEGR